MRTDIHIFYYHNVSVGELYGLHQVFFNPCNLQGISNWKLYILYEGRLFACHCPYLGISRLNSYLILLCCYCWVQVPSVRPRLWNNDYSTPFLVVLANNIKVKLTPSSELRREEHRKVVFTDGTTKPGMVDHTWRKMLVIKPGSEYTELGETLERQTPEKN